MRIVVMTVTNQVSLEGTIAAFVKWRSEKASSERGNKPIPQELWDMVFTLEENGLSQRTLKSALNLSATQYRTQQSKRQQPQPTLQKESNSLNEQALFAEAVVTPNSSIQTPEVPSLVEAAKETQHKIKQLKTTDLSKHELSTETIIVECIHNEGHRLKIHATSKKMSEIFKAFFQQPESVTTL